MTPLTWASAPWPAERDFLVDLGEPRAQAADGPLQRGVAPDQGPLAAEVPGRVVPVLDIDQPEPRALRQEDLDRPDVERLAPRRHRDRPIRGPEWLRPLPRARRGCGSDRHAPRWARPTRLNSGALDRDPLGHVEQRPARPERRMQRREDVVGRE